MAIDGQVCVHRWLFVDPANHEGAIQDLCCGASEQHYYGCEWYQTTANVCLSLSCGLYQFLLLIENTTPLPVS